MRPPVPIRSFVVRPEGRWLYWSVHYYRSLREMRTAYNIFRGLVNKNAQDASRLSFARKALALTSGVTAIDYRKGASRTQPCLGRIFLAFPHTGVGILSHEATHAAKFYFDRLGLALEDDTDERFAKIVGDMTRDMARRIW